MRLDFAREYAGRTDDEIRLLLKDRHNLVDEARDALDVEVQKRRSSGFELHVKEQRNHDFISRKRKTTEMSMSSSFIRRS